MASSLLKITVDARAERSGCDLPSRHLLVHGLKLATRNIADFKPFGVRIVDPWKG